MYLAQHSIPIPKSAFRIGPDNSNHRNGLGTEIYAGWDKTNGITRRPIDSGELYSECPKLKFQPATYRVTTKNVMKQFFSNSQSH